MGNVNSNKSLASENSQDGDLISPILEKQVENILADQRTQPEDAKNVTDANIKEKSEKKEKKEKKSRLKDIITNKKDLIPEEFSDLSELEDLYRIQKTKILSQDLCEWEIANGPNGEVTCIVVTDDNKYLIWGTRTGSLKVIETRTKEQGVLSSNTMKALNFVLACIQSLAVSKDSKYLVAALENKIEVFTLMPAQLVKTNFENQNKIKALVLSGDGKYLITADEKKTIKVFDFFAQKAVNEMTAIYEVDISCITISNQNNYIISASDEGSIKIFDFDLKQELHYFPSVHNGAIRSIVVSHDENFITTSSVDKSIKVLSLREKRELYCFNNIHKGPISSVAVSKDNKQIFTGSDDGSIKILDLESEKEIYEFQNIHEKPITSIALMDDGKYLVSGSIDESVKIFDTKTKEKIHSFELPHKGRVISSGISNDNKFIISCADDGSIKVFDSNRRPICNFFNHYKKEIQSVIISQNSNYIVSTSLDHSIQVHMLNFETKTLIPVHEFSKLEGGNIFALAISSDDRFIFSASSDHFLRIFDIKELKEVKKAGLKRKINLLSIFINIRSLETIISLCLSQDMKYIVAGTNEGVVMVLNFENIQELIAEYQVGNQEPIKKLAISSDNKHIISGQDDAIYNVFNLETKEIVYNLDNKSEDKGDLISINITNDNRYIILSSYTYAKVFDLEARQELHCYKLDAPNMIYSVAISNDDQYILFGLGGSLKMNRLKLKQDVNSLVHGIQDHISFLDMSQDSKYLVLMAFRGLFKVYNLESKEEIFAGKSRGLAVSSNTHSLVYGDADTHVIKTLNFETKKEDICLQDVGPVNKISITSDSKMLVISNKESLRAFDLDTKEEKWNIKTEIELIAISKDNKCVIFTEPSSQDLQISDLQTGKNVYILKGVHESHILSLTFSDDSKYIICGSLEGSIKILDIQTKQEVQNLENVHSEGVRFISISSDNRYIISGSDDGSFKIFEMHTWREIQQFRNGKSLIAGGSAIMSKDNKYIILGGSPNVLKILPNRLEGKDKLAYISPKISLSQPFARYEDFLLSSWPKDPNTQKRLLLHYCDMYVSPHNWTILHLLAIFNPSVISQVPRYASFQMPFLLDTYGKTPLHYLLAQKYVDYGLVKIMMEYIADYLEDKTKIKAYEYQQICKSLSSHFMYLVSKSTPSLSHRYLELFYPETFPRNNEVLPDFGDFEEKYIKSKTPTIQDEGLAELHEEGDHRIVFHTNMLYLDYDPRSDDMFMMVRILSEVKEESIFKMPIIANLIDHLWKSTETTMNASAILFSGLMIQLSIYIASSQDSLRLEIGILFLTIQFIISEFMEAKALGVEYIKSIWNWVDLAELFMIITFISTKLSTDEPITGEAWLVCAIIILGYVRWLSYLRLFTPTRILIEIILVVLFDMMGFITIIGAILVGFSLIFLEFDRNQIDSQEYGSHFYNTFKLLFGNYDDTDYSLSQIVLVSTLLCVLNVVLLNLLIAIIGDSYGKVQTGRDLIDAQIRLDMIQEAMILMQKIKPKNTLDKGYLIYRLPAVTEEENIERREWGNRISEIQSLINQNKDEMKIMGEKIKNEVKEEIKSEMRIMGDQINQLKNEIKQNVQNEMKGNEETRKEIQDLKQLVGILIGNMNEISKTIKPNS